MANGQTGADASSKNDVTAENGVPGSVPSEFDAQRSSKDPYEFTDGDDHDNPARKSASACDAGPGGTPVIKTEVGNGSCCQSVVLTSKQGI